MSAHPETIPPGREAVALRAGDYGWRYEVESAARLLRAIDENRGLCIGGEQYPNALNCIDSAQALEDLLKSPKVGVPPKVDIESIKAVAERLQESNDQGFNQLAAQLQSAIGGEQAPVTERTLHLCMGVRGGIQRHSRLPPEGTSYAKDRSGRVMTNAEFVVVLMDELAKGHEVIPMSEGCGNPCSRSHLGCSGFNYAAGGGCPGYVQPEGGT